MQAAVSADARKEMYSWSVYKRVHYMALAAAVCCWKEKISYILLKLLYRLRINYRRISLRHNLSMKCRNIVKFVSITHRERNIWNGPIVATAISRKKSEPGQRPQTTPSAPGHPGHQIWQCVIYSCGVSLWTMFTSHHFQRHYHNCRERFNTAMGNVIQDMLERVWREWAYRLDICRVTRGAHIESI